MNHLKAQGRIKVRNEPWWWARVTLPCCRKSHNLKRRANWSGALLAQPEGRGGVLKPLYTAEKLGLFSRENRVVWAHPGLAGRFVLKIQIVVETYPFLLQMTDQPQCPQSQWHWITNMKCLSLWTQVSKHFFGDFNYDLIKPLVAEQSDLWCNFFCILKTWFQ